MKAPTSPANDPTKQLNTEGVKATYICPMAAPIGFPFINMLANSPMDRTDTPQIIPRAEPKATGLSFKFDIMRSLYCPIKFRLTDYLFEIKSLY